MNVLRNAPDRRRAPEKEVSELVLQAAPSTGYATFPPTNYGGVEGFIYETGKRMSKVRGIGVIYGGPELREGNAIEQDGISIFKTPLTRFPESIPLPAIGIPISLANNLFAAVRLFALARQIDFEMLHMHESHTQFLLARHIKKRKVFTFHGSHTCIPYRKQTLHAKVLAWKFDGYTARECDHLIAISNLSKQNIIEYTGFAEEDVSVVHYGVDAEKFRRNKDTGALAKKLGLEGRPVIISVSRMAHDKGIDTTLEALSRLKKDIPGIACLFCGISPHDLRNSGYGKRLLGIILKNNLQKNAYFLGKIARDDLPKYLSLASVFVHPARVEAFGLAVGEAMACGVPPVCMENSGGPDDLVQDGKNGFLIQRDSPEALYDRAKALICDDTASKMLGARARGTIQRDFTWEKAAKKLLAVYRSLE